MYSLSFFFLNNFCAGGNIPDVLSGDETLYLCPELFPTLAAFPSCFNTVLGRAPLATGGELILHAWSPQGACVKLDSLTVIKCEFRL